MVVGVGDDCAVVDLAGAGDLQAVLTTDMLTEGTHFIRGNDTDWQALGRKAMTANVSDLASMGARPRLALISLALTGDFPLAAVTALYRGMGAEASKWGATIVGGDTVGAISVAVNVALVGTRPRGIPIPMRSAAEAGQFVYVSGHLGASKAGLRILTEPAFAHWRTAAAGRTLLRRHLTPEPRVVLGETVARLCPGLAMIDISDSLASELGRLAQASRCGFEIDQVRLPVSAALRRYCRAENLPIVDHALFSGEEYELLFCCGCEPERLAAMLAAEKVETCVTCIGRATRRRGIRYLHGGSPVEGPVDASFQHFSATKTAPRSRPK